METAPRIAPFVCGVVFACVTMGVAVATGVSLGVRTFMDPRLVPVYGWRIAFILGGLGGVLSFVLRRSLEESPEFERMRSLASRQPFRELLKTHASTALIGCALLAGTGCFNGLFFSHLPAYLSGVLQYDPRQAVLFADHRRDRVVGRHPRHRLAWRPHSTALPAATRRGVAAGFRLPFYAALESRAINLTLLSRWPDLVAGLTNGSFAVPADGLVPDPHPLHRRGAGLQRQLHAFQRHGAARGDVADWRARAGPPRRPA